MPRGRRAGSAFRVSGRRKTELQTACPMRRGPEKKEAQPPCRGGEFCGGRPFHGGSTPPPPHSKWSSGRVAASPLQACPTLGAPGRHVRELLPWTARSAGQRDNQPLVRAASVFAVSSRIDLNSKTTRRSSSERENVLSPHTIWRTRSPPLHTSRSISSSSSRCVGVGGSLSERVSSLETSRFEMTQASGFLLSCVATGASVPRDDVRSAMKS
jgi:hypothetical protein